MKKQILAAAVAASVSAVAIADISITGATKVNYTYTDKYNNTTSNGFKNETDLAIVGKNGDTSVVMKLALDEGHKTSNGSATTSTTDISSTSATITSTTHTHTVTTTTTDGSSLTLEDVYLTTKVGDVSLKVGDWDNGDNGIRASSRSQNKVQASTTLGGVGLSWTSGANMDDEVKVSAALGPVNASYNMKANSVNDLSLSAELAGFTIAHTQLDATTAAGERDKTEISTTAGGIGIKVGQMNAGTSATITGDSWMGDYEANTGAYELSAGMDVTAIQLSTSLDGNKVSFTHAAIDKDTSGGVDRSFNKIIVTRPLANGTTFEATYTDTTQDGSTANSNQSLDLELAVKF
jgi:hypothetical protein